MPAAVVAVLPNTSAPAKPPPESAGRPIIQTEGAAGVLLRLSYPRMAFPPGGAAPSELAALGTPDTSHCSRADRVAAALAWVSVLVPIANIALLPVENPESSNAVAWPTAFAMSLPFAINGTVVHGLYIIILDVIVGGMHPLAHRAVLRRWNALTCFVLLLVGQAILFATIGFVPMGSLVSIGMFAVLSVAGLWTAPSLRRLVDAAVFINWACLLPAAVPCAYLYAIVSSGDSTAAQLPVVAAYELVMWALKLGLRSSRMGPELGLLLGELLIEGFCHSSLMASFALLQAEAFVPMLVGQLAGAALPVVLQTRWRPRALPRSSRLWDRPVAERRRLAAMRFGVTCATHVATSLQYILFTLLVHSGPNADSLSQGAWTDAQVARVCRYAATWAAATAALLAVGDALMARHWGGVRPVRELWALSLRHTNVVVAMTCSAVAIVGSFSMRAYRVMWLLQPENGFSS